MKKTIHILPPKADEVPALTDRLVEIKQLLDALTEEKKEIEAKLEAWALSQQQEPLKDEKREGRKVVMAGARHRATVVFSSDLIIGSFKADGPKHQELLRLLGPLTHESQVSATALLEKFFTPPDTWENRFKDGQKFRTAAAEWLSAEVAPKFIAACRSTDRHGIAKSKTAFEVSVNGALKPGDPLLAGKEAAES
jgi:hypothetical protein